MLYKEIIDIINSLKNYEKTGFHNLKNNINLKKIHNILKKLNNPHLQYRTIHIAGTKAKGSISTFISYILKQAQYKVGLFTSPHIIDSRERIQINNNNISKNNFIKSFEYLLKYYSIEFITKNFTFFELYTILAIICFYKEKVDFAIFEVGLGGRLDATNVIKPDICVITPISYDHTQFLGTRLNEIAQEKIAIIKKESICISSFQKKTVLNLIKRKCKKEDVKLLVLGRDFVYKNCISDNKGNIFDLHTKSEIYKHCKINLLGNFQIDNCSIAISVADILLKHKHDKKEIIRKGIKKAFIPGRLEILKHKPIIVIDGAQNELSINRLISCIKQLFVYNNLNIILGISKDKNIKKICSQISKNADNIILTKSSNLRAIEPHEMKTYFKNKNIFLEKDTKKALNRGYLLCKKNDLLLVTGSFFVISEIRKYINKNKKK